MTYRWRLNITEDVYIVGNFIFDPIGSGIFFGADGETQTDPSLTTSNIHISNNVITGDWNTSCIQGTIPAITEKVHITNNICTKTGTTGASSSGIIVRRTNGATLPAENIIIEFNTITASSGASLGKAGLFVNGGLFNDMQIVSNQIRDVSTFAVLLRGNVQNAIVSNNIIDGSTVGIGVVLPVIILVEYFTAILLSILQLMDFICLPLLVKPSRLLLETM